MFEVDSTSKGNLKQFVNQSICNNLVLSNELSDKGWITTVKDLESWRFER